MTITNIELSAYKQQINAPGRFQGEPVYSPYFHTLAMDGGGEMEFAEGEGNDIESDIQFESFRVNADEEEAFGLPIGSHVLIWNDSQGFAYAKQFATRSEMPAFIRTYLGLWSRYSPPLFGVEE